ncbi:hypothetical protein ACHMW5_03245 [Azospirillum melinis]|uniref:hypothetical protein n=1 Tax=Azospirillum melinis TaxID=328839 RepID=UPI00375718E9
MNQILRRTLLGLAAMTTMAVATTSAMAATMTVYVKNDTTATVEFQAGGGFQGVPSPSFPTTIIPSGTTAAISVTSPYPTSTGGSFYYRRQDNLKRCFFVPSRTMSGSVWNWPTTNATPSATGVNCSGAASNVNSNGDWTVNFRIY